MTADWDSLVDAAPPEVRDALDRLRHHVALTTPGADSVGRRDSTWTGRAEAHRAARDAMGSVLAWASRHHSLLCPECAAITCHDPRLACPGRAETEEATTGG